MTRLFRASLVTVICLATALSVLGLAQANSASSLSAPAVTCTTKAYAYAGVFSKVAGSGIRATVTALAPAQVTDGHVAGWIGVGGTNAGPGGRAEWLQAGVAGTAGGSTEIYAEVTQIGSGTTYTTLVANAAPGKPYSLAVLELPAQPDRWQVWLNGKPVTEPVLLPGSGTFQPMAMSESWDGGTPTCNGFSYRFDKLQISTATAAWHPLTDTSTLSDTGYRVLDRTLGGFTAASGRP